MIVVKASTRLMNMFTIKRGDGKVFQLPNEMPARDRSSYPIAQHKGTVVTDFLSSRSSTICGIKHSRQSVLAVQYVSATAELAPAGDDEYQFRSIKLKLLQEVLDLNQCRSDLYLVQCRTERIVDAKAGMLMNINIPRKGGQSNLMHINPMQICQAQLQPRLMQYVICLLCFELANTFRFIMTSKSVRLCFARSHVNT